MVYNSQYQECALPRPSARCSEAEQRPTAPTLTSAPQDYLRVKGQALFDVIHRTITYWGATQLNLPEPEK